MCRVLSLFAGALLLIPSLLFSQLIPEWEAVIDSVKSRNFSFRALAAADTRHFALMTHTVLEWKVLLSSDAGEHWNVGLTLPKNDSLELNTVEHPAANLIVLLCDSTFNRGLSAGFQIIYDYRTVILRSTDGGQNWESTFIGSEVRSRKTPYMKMASAEIGYLLQWPSVNDDDHPLAVEDTNQHLWRTVDGGAAWNEIALPAGVGPVLDITTVTDSIVVLRTLETLVRSTDKGMTWETFPLTLPPSFNIALDFPTPLIGYAAWSTGINESPAIIYRTTDGGHQWTKMLDTNGDGRLIKVQFANAANGIALGAGGVCRTRDAGATWSWEAMPSTGYGRAYMAMIAMPHPDTVVMCGSGFALRYVGNSGLAAPRMLLPLRLITDTIASNVPVVWSRIDGADRYHVQVLMRDTLPFPDYTHSVIDFTTPLLVDQPMWHDTAFSLIDLQAGKEYVTRVRAVGTTMLSTWSEWRSIRVVGEPSSSVEQDGAATTVLRVTAHCGETVELPGQGGRDVRWSLSDIMGRTFPDAVRTSNHSIVIDTRGLVPGRYLVSSTENGVRSVALLLTP